MKSELKRFYQRAAGMLRHAQPTSPSAHKGRTLITLFIMLLTTATAWAETVQTYYIDASGTRHDVTATVLTGTETTLGQTDQTNWYVVNNDINHTGLIQCYGNVHIILCDGKTMTVDGSGQTIWGGSDCTIAIYGQALGTGTLTASSSGSTAISNNGNLIINGGTINATTTNKMSSAILANGTVTINGGTINADGSSGKHGIIGANGVTINGGKVNATGALYCYGIWAQKSSNITLGWTRATDYIKASSFETNDGTVAVAPGLAFLTDDATPQQVSGTVSDRSTINGKMLTPDVSSCFTVNGGIYQIWNAYGWGLFCDALQDNDTYNRFSGKTVKLADDIIVSRMAGSDKHDFCGTFDGDEHTITLDGNSSNGCYTLFRNAVGATIRDLHVTGTITTAGKYAAGFISGMWGNVTIENCRSSVIIRSSVSGDGTHGGFVAVNNSGTLDITGCTFDGKLLTTGTTATSHCGGFVGWNVGTVAIINSLYAPAALEEGETEVQAGDSNPSATFARNTATITNSYYTRTLGDAQGKQAHSITAGENVTVANAGTPETVYTVSGITSYSTGIKYNDVLYAGSGDAVSLTLSNTATGAPAGYQYDGYTASAGTLSGSTLTMPDQDVTVSVNTAILTVLPWDGYGTESSPYIIEYASQLDLLAYRVNGTHGETANNYYNTYFKLNNDISYPHTSAWNDFDSHESNYEAIGGYYGGNRYFSGHFDGNNKTISGIRIYKDGDDETDMNQGIFGLTDSGADIHDLILADARITGNIFTGGIVGENYDGTVTRCHVAADVAVCAVQSHAYYHGGIVGRNRSGTIEQCTSAATLTIAGNSKYYGGIAGENNGGTLRDNLAIGATVPAAADNTYGAITGRNYNGGTLQRNYYAACKVANTENATGVGCGYIDDGNGGYITADVNNDNNPDGAVCINTLTLAANQAPDQNYWTTYYNSALGYKIDDGENAWAYTAEYDNTDPNAPQLTLHKLGKVIPKGTAVIIVGEDNSIGMTASDETVTVPTNNLDGVDVRTEKSTLGSGTFYVLGSTAKNGFGFHKYNADYMPARKAYLLIADSSAPSLTMVFDNETTEIKTTDFTDYTDKADTWYSLDGRKLDKQPTAKGIYIHNGRKEVVR